MSCRGLRDNFSEKRSVFERSLLTRKMCNPGRVAGVFDGKVVGIQDWDLKSEEQPKRR